MNARQQYLEHLANLTDEAQAADAAWDDDSFVELTVFLLLATQQDRIQSGCDGMERHATWRSA